MAKIEYSKLLPLAIILLSTIFMLEKAHAKNQAIERVIWDKMPITVMLNTGRERIVHFPIDVRYWLPDKLANTVTILSANGVLYIQAHEKFDKTRIRVQAIETQKIYLLDLVSHDGYAVSDELVITDKGHLDNKSKSTEVKKQSGDWFVRLTRFAAQSLYAPERLMPSDTDIHRVKINSVNTIPLVRGGDIEAVPITSWKGGGLYVTAVLIKNLSAHIIPITLTGRQHNPGVTKTLALETDIRGDWLAVVPQHTTLGQAGENDDRTTLYLISSRSFGESL